jgi:hypothetical protein
MLSIILQVKQPIRNQEHISASLQQQRNSQLLEQNLVQGVLAVPIQPPLPPLAVERADGWSCNRCTLINYNAQIWCEACGGKRLDGTCDNGATNNAAQSKSKPSLAIVESELDAASEDAPPRVGHVLDKLVLFTSIEAKAKETPSLHRRSGEFGRKLQPPHHHMQQQHFGGGSSAMMPIDENPLQRTLERITQNQAQLVKSNDNFNRQLSDLVSTPSRIASGSPNLNPDSVNPAETKTKTNAHSNGAFVIQNKNPTQIDIIKQQERLLEEARRNLTKQEQNVEKFTLSEQAMTIPRPLQDNKISDDQKVLLNEVLPKSVQDIETSNGKKSLEKEILTKANQSSVRGNGKEDHEINIEIPETLPIISSLDIQSKIEADVKSVGPVAPNFIASSVKSVPGATFDFTKTPRSFLVSSQVSRSKEISKGTNAPPRLEILSTSISRKFSVPDSDTVRQARLEFFSDKKDADNISDDRQHHTVTSGPFLSGKSADCITIGKNKKDCETTPAKLPNKGSDFDKHVNCLQSSNKEISNRNLNSLDSAKLLNKPGTFPVSDTEMSKMQVTSEEKAVQPQMMKKIESKGPSLIQPVETFPSPSNKCIKVMSQCNKVNSVTPLETKTEIVNNINKSTKENNYVSSPSATNKPQLSRIPVLMNDLPPNKSKLAAASPPAPRCPPKKRDLQAEPYYSTPVSPPRPVTPPRPALPLKQTASLSRFTSKQEITLLQRPITPPRPTSPLNELISSADLDFSRQSLVPPQPSSPTFSSGSSSPPSPPAHDMHKLYHQPSASSRQIFSAQSMTEINNALRTLSKPIIKPNVDNRSACQRNSLLLNELARPDWVPQRCYTPLITHPLAYQRPFSRQSTTPGSPLMDLDFSDYSLYDNSMDFGIRRSISRMDSNSLISENNYSAITPEVSRKLSLSVRTEPKFPKDFGFVSSSNNNKKDVMPKPPRRRSKEVGGGGYSRPVSRLSNNNSSLDETPVNSPIFRPKECGQHFEIEIICFIIINLNIKSYILFNR